MARLHLNRHCWMSSSLLLLAAVQQTYSMASTGTRVNVNTGRCQVAIIGGGIAGLSCAQELSKNGGFDVTCYDTGRLRPGGRCSSRQVGDAPPKDDEITYPLLSQVRYDHAAQLIVDPHPQHFPGFSQQVKEWVDQGILQEFPDESVVQIFKNGDTRPLSATTFYHAVQGMGSIPTSMVETSGGSFQLEQDVWVSPSSGVRYQKNSGKWKLQANGETLGYYDQLILAHNGKCADRIMSKTPAKDLHRLLRVNFAPTVPAHGGAKMTLNSLYSLTIVLPKGSCLSKALPEPFQCGFSDHPQLRMISCQSRKYPTTATATATATDADYEVWNILSSAKFAKKYKAPQEFLPPETVEEVTALLLQAVQESLCLDTMENESSPSTILTPLEKRLQLWGAAVPLNVWRSKEKSSAKPFLWDEQYQVGVCGDWLLEPSIAGAWTSGQSMAQHLMKSNTSPRGTVGLEGNFERSESASKLGLAALPLDAQKSGTGYR
jgi:predicted NAD/FAD-dependent oxidoreductase